ncbi:MAG: hypothetical protein SFT81_06710 [Candidatus Caenarcaniphilales bacterium]|nr:hypothetical protein [Candidatus Caenarcaniphilales bacterium]
MSALRKENAFFPVPENESHSVRHDGEQYESHQFKLQQFTVYTSTPEQILFSRLKRCTKITAITAGASLLLAALMQFCLLGIELEVSEHFTNLETQLKNREDLKSYLGHAYSWHNLDRRMQQLKALQANMLEVNTKPKTIDKVISESNKTD